MQFCANFLRSECFGFDASGTSGASGAAAAFPLICEAGVKNGNQFSANLRLTDYGCYDITAQAQGCGGTASDGPERTASIAGSGA